MKKTILSAAIVAIFALFSSNLTAQISVTGNLGMQQLVGENIDSDPLFGFGLEGKYDIDESLRVGLGFGSYSTKDEFLGIEFRSFVRPLYVLGEYTFMEGPFSPYAGLNLGLYTFGAKVEDERNSDSYFGVAPLVGANYFVTDNIGINANARFTVVFGEDDTANLLGIGIGATYLID
ncbi:MAG: porin family protein [Flavobacteriales bacterium]|nr:porin family protein [Flavobacteriales bacterium]